MAVQSGMYRGVSAEERAADRRARLMEAALEVWADPGRRTTMTAICSEAGLTERYFYESFSDLDDALNAVLTAVGEEIETTCTAAADAVEEDPAARVYAAINAFVQFLVDDPRKGRVSLIEAQATPELRQRRTALLRSLAEYATREARDHFGLPPRSAREDEFTGLMFIGGMAETFTSWLDGTLEATPEELLDVSARAFLCLYG